MTRFRLFRLRRAYRKVARLEAALKYRRETRELRSLFAQQSVAMMDGTWKRLGVGRAERRRARRQMAGMS